MNPLLEHEGADASPATPAAQKAAAGQPEGPAQPARRSSSCMVLAMMVLPLPPWMLDLLFTFNIAMALMVMMVASQMVKPLDFAAFPRCCW
jgi:hypothetical protein